MINEIAVSFIGGLFTVFSPCILPVLPFVFGASMDNDRRAGISMVTGLVIVFALLTLLGGLVFQIVGLSPGTVRIISAVILGFFGLALVIPALEHKTEYVFSKLPKLGSSKHGSKGLFAGAALGFVWAPCAGPVLGVIGSLVALQGTYLKVSILMFAFAFGVWIPLALFVLGGTRIAALYKNSRQLVPTLRRCFGVAAICMAILISTNRDGRIIANLTEALHFNASDDGDSYEQRLVDSLKN